MNIMLCIINNYLISEFNCSSEVNTTAKTTTNSRTHSTTTTTK